MSKRKINNDQFRSSFESQISKQLSAAQGAGLIEDYGYETDRIGYTTTHWYTPDWKVTLDNATFFVETKGWLRPEDKRTLLAVWNQNPTMDLRLVFQKNLPLYKGSKSRYSDWAEKHGFKYAIGEIPRDWFE